MKKNLFCALALAVCANGWAQTNITPEVLQTLEGSYTGTPYDDLRPIQDADDL